MKLQLAIVGFLTAFTSSFNCANAAPNDDEIASLFGQQAYRKVVELWDHRQAASWAPGQKTRVFVGWSACKIDRRPLGYAVLGQLLNELENTTPKDTDKIDKVVKAIADCERASAGASRASAEADGTCEELRLAGTGGGTIIQRTADDLLALVDQLRVRVAAGQIFTHAELEGIAKKLDRGANVLKNSSSRITDAAAMVPASPDRPLLPGSANPAAGRESQTVRPETLSGAQPKN